MCLLTAHFAIAAGRRDGTAALVQQLAQMQDGEIDLQVMDHHVTVLASGKQHQLPSTCM